MTPCLMISGLTPRSGTSAGRRCGAERTQKALADSWRGEIAALPFSAVMLDILAAGGLVPYFRKHHDFIVSDFGRVKNKDRQDHRIKRI